MAEVPSYMINALIRTAHTINNVLQEATPNSSSHNSAKINDQILLKMILAIISGALVLMSVIIAIVAAICCRRRARRRILQRRSIYSGMSDFV